jgi:hypothetical protein
MPPPSSDRDSVAKGPRTSYLVSNDDGEQVFKSSLAVSGKADTLAVSRAKRWNLIVFLVQASEAHVGKIPYASFHSLLLDRNTHPRARPVGLWRDCEKRDCRLIDLEPSRNGVLTFDS